MPAASGAEKSQRSNAAAGVSRERGLELVEEARGLVEVGERRKAERLLREAIAVDEVDVILAAAAEMGRLFDLRGEISEAMAWWGLVLTHNGQEQPPAAGGSHL